MIRKKKVPQPLGVVTPGSIITKPEHYQAAMSLELQKFKNESKQLSLLLEAPVEPGEEDIEHLEVFGLDFTIPQDRALSAIQYLLYRTEFKGHYSEPGESQAFKWKGDQPFLIITPKEYLEAYGMNQTPHTDKKTGKVYKRVQGAERAEAMKALHSLTEPRSIIYERKRYIGKAGSRKQLSNIIRTKRSLITISEAFTDLEQTEAEKVKAGEANDGKLRKMAIGISPLLFDGIREGFFVLKPIALHDEIQQLYPPKTRIARCISLFIEWLLTLNKQQIQISRRNLAERLRLDTLIKSRKWQILDERMLECFNAAQQLNYLTDFSHNKTTDNYSFELNPERCKRIPQSSGDEDTVDGGEDEV